MVPTSTTLQDCTYVSGHDHFCPEKEDFSFAPVWIHLYSLPQEFWLEEILMGIGNTLGRYVKSSEATKQRRYTSYAASVFT
jgi:hypothetical protein